MTPARRQALRSHRRKLEKAFAEAAAAATTPGKGKTWFVPYFVAVLRVYRKLTIQIVDDRALSSALGKNPKDAFIKLLKTSKRDPKMRSRWAAALANAYKSNVSPEELTKWLKKGGGVSGRARRLLTHTQHKFDQPQDGLNNASQLNALPEANGPVAEATSDWNEQS
jgi:hypothetical protein